MGHLKNPHVLSGPTYFQIVTYLLILYFLSVKTVISIGAYRPNIGTPPRTFLHCLAETKVDISYPSNETWWYDSQTIHVPALRHPYAIAYAACTSDVQALVRCAVKHSIKICPRSGGHSYAAFSNEDNHLVIDVSRIAYVKINPVSSNGLETASVGAGIRMGRLYYELGQHKMTFPGTSDPTIGLGGAVATGGNGFLMRMWGETADNIQELNMVDYRGKVLVANNRTHSDLFFALRGGGGGSYGVVVGMKLKIYPYPKVMTGFSLSWTKRIPASEFMQAWFKWKPWETLPPEMFVRIMYQTNSVMYGMYVGEDGYQGLQRILDESGFLDLGPEDNQRFRYRSSADALEIQAWLYTIKYPYSNATIYRALNTPTSFVLSPLKLPPYPNPVHPTWQQIQNDPRVNATHPYGFVGTTGPISNLDPITISHDYNLFASQAFAQDLDEAAYEVIEKFVSVDGTNIGIILSGGQIYAVPEDFNAFPHRRIYFFFEYYTSYYPLGTHPYSGLNGQTELLGQILTAMEPYSNHMSYQGHASLFWTTDPKIYMPRYYGNHVAKLVKTKRIYDPTDVFNNTQSTPTTY